MRYKRLPRGLRHKSAPSLPAPSLIEWRDMLENIIGVRFRYDCRTIRAEVMFGRMVFERGDIDYGCMHKNQ